MTTKQRRRPRLWESLTGEEEAALWQDYKQRGTEAAKSRLVTAYLPFSHMLAAKLYAKRHHDEVEFADYAQFAALGLIDAIERFEPGREFAFVTYAPHRINGAILNGLEGYTERQRQLSVKKRVKERIESILPDEPQHGGDVSRAFERIATVAVGLAIGMMLEDEGHYAEEEGTTAHTPYAGLELRQLQEKMLALVEQLPEREALIIRSHYLHQLPFEDIARMLGLTKGRISQLHKGALQKLKDLAQQAGPGEQAW